MNSVEVLVLARQPLDVIPLWGVFAGTVVLLLIADRLGHRIGAAWTARDPKRSDPSISGIVAAELGLLAFLLAFTFGVSASRFEDRRLALLEETNAIGTAYLRTSLLPKELRTNERAWFRDYVDTRLAISRRELPMDQGIAHCEELQQKLWGSATAAAVSDPHSLPYSLFVEALNDMIDMHTKRITIIQGSRIPITVWIVLGVVAVLSFLSLGFHAGLTKAHRSPTVFVLAVTMAAVIWLVADLDRPAEGYLRISQQPMMDLRKSMEKGGE